ncbi:MAG: GNAT family N-acetyltransferase, partial [Candidatus Thorarchaeota archaeon]
MFIIRSEKPEDIPAIRHVNTLAFGQPNEADLVDALRRAGVLTISLLAVKDDLIVGHIAFSPIPVNEFSCSLQLNQFHITWRQNLRFFFIVDCLRSMML